MPSHECWSTLVQFMACCRPCRSIFITRVSEVMMFSPCLFVCLFEGLVPHKQYFACTLLGMSSCASYVSRTHDVIDDVARSQSRSNFEIDISPSIFELECRSKAQNIGNANGYLPGILNFQCHFRRKRLSWAQNGGHFECFEILNTA